MRRLTSVALVTVLVVGLSACGVTTDRHPRALSTANVPFGLLAPNPSSTTTTPTTIRPENQAVVQVYLLGPSFRLVAVDRVAPAPVTLTNVLATLLIGPSEGESNAGYSSVINSQTRLLGAKLVDGVATIDLSSDFASVGVQEQPLAIAQFVYTATGVAGVQGVTISVEGTPVEVPTQDGIATHAPVSRRDYERLALP